MAAEEEEVFTFSKQKIEVDALSQKKLYYIHVDFVDENYNLEYKFYCLDHLSQTGCVVINGDVQDMPAPILTLERYKYANWVSFGALDSKIYVVGGRKYLKMIGRRTLRVCGMKYTKVVNRCTLRRVSRELKPVVDVYIFDTSLAVPRMTFGPPLRTHVNDEPIVIPFKGKLYVMPHSVVAGDHRGKVRSFIHVLDPVANSWSVIEFPSVMWEAGRLIGDARKYKIIGYTLSDSEILLSPMMTLGHGRIGVLFYNTETCAWSAKNAMPNIRQLAFL